MTEQILIVDELVLVRWHVMTVAGVGRALAAIDEVCARGAVAVLVGMVGDGVAPPLGEVNVALTAAIDTARQRCSSVNLVLDGTTFSSAGIRSAATAMFFLKGDRRTKMYKSLGEALADRVGGRADLVLAAARDAGLILATAPLRRTA